MSGANNAAAIFALALSPDDENKYVAIAGAGPKTSDVAVLERSTGKMVHHGLAIPSKEEQAKGVQVNAIWSMAYALDGKSVAFGDSFGGVWIWDFKEAPKRLGKHPNKPVVGTTNKVRFVHFFDNHTLVSVAENGTANRWDPSKGPQNPDPLKDFDTEGNAIFRVALSPDEKWYAVAVKKPLVVLRSVDGDATKNRKIKIKQSEFARAVAFDVKSDRLAVSIGGRLSQEGFLMEAPDHIAFYDLKDRDAAPKGPPTSLYRAWFFAFHPGGKDVAIAAGENHEVTLWNLADMDQPVSVMAGAGKSLWAVALSADGYQIAFRDQRNPAECLIPTTAARDRGAFSIRRSENG